MKKAVADPECGGGGRGEEEGRGVGRGMDPP